jgi:hypothetical protein
VNDRPREVVNMTPNRLRLFVISALAGAIGGVLSWLYPLIATQSPIPLRFIPIFGAVVFGAVASLIGIFLANTDTSDIYRCFVYALVCGLFWKPIIDGGQSLIKEAEKARPTLQAQDLAPDVRKAAEALKKADPAALPANLNAATDAGVKLAALVPQIQDSAVKAEAERALQQLVTAVSEAGSRDPKGAVQSLTAIAERTAQGGASEIGRNATVAVADLSSHSIVATAVKGLTAVATSAAEHGHKELAMESHLKAAEVATQVPSETALPPHQVQALKENAEEAARFFSSVGDEVKASAAAQQAVKLKAMAERVKQ